jgi:flagellar assembly protein FliH
MSSSPNHRPGQPVIRASDAGEVDVARFNVDLRPSPQIPAELAEAARAAGYADGWAQAQRAAQQIRKAERERTDAIAAADAQARANVLDQSVTAINTAVNRLEKRLGPDFEELEEIILSMAVELAQALLGRELGEVGNRAADAMHRAFNLLPPTGLVTVRLHPDDYRTLTDSDSLIQEYSYQGRVVTLRRDPSLQPGDAIAECAATTVDAQLSRALERVRGELQA